MAEFLTLGLAGWLTLAVVAGATYAMARENLGPDLVMFSALSVLSWLFGCLSVSLLALNIA